MISLNFPAVSTLHGSLAVADADAAETTRATAAPTTKASLDKRMMELLNFRLRCDTIPWRTNARLFKTAHLCMGAVASNIPINRYDTVKAESYQEKLTFPPFTPNRVVEQFSYVRVGDDYTESPLPVLPHRTARKPSEANLRRRVEDFSRSACFVW